MAVPVPPVPEWISDPLVTKLIAAAAVVVAVSLLIRVSQIWLGRSLKDADTRYPARKLVALSGYFLAVVGITVIFKDRLGGLTVAIGVAGWIAISFAGFYRPGDRVQVGGILRTTLMELGEWVHSDLHSRRIVRVANSFVFKQPGFNYSGDFPWMEFTLRCVVDVKARRSTKDNLETRILEEFDRAGDQARIASATVQLVQPPPFEVGLRSPRQDDAQQH